MRSPSDHCGLSTVTPDDGTRVTVPVTPVFIASLNVTDTTPVEAATFVAPAAGETPVTVGTSASGRAVTVTVNAFVSLAEPLVMVAVSVTVTSPAGYAGRTTAPLSAITAALLDDHEMLVPSEPEVASATSPVTADSDELLPLIASQSSAALAVATASASVSERMGTVRVNAFVSLAEPLAMVAVSVTVASPAGDTGRATAPLSAITAALLDDHEIIVPLAPAAGSERFSVTADSNELPPLIASHASAVLSASTAASSVSWNAAVTVTAQAGILNEYLESGSISVNTTSAPSPSLCTEVEIAK